MKSTISGTNVVKWEELNRVPERCANSLRRDTGAVTPMSDHSIPTTTEETTENGLCECGCGQSPRKVGSRFVQGHNRKPNQFPPAVPEFDSAMGCYRVSLTSKKMPGLYVYFDAVDLELVRQFRWFPKSGTRTVYAHTASGAMTMHRAILSPPAGKDVDHINGDGLDNRRLNLRVCSRKENSRNITKLPRHEKTSRFYGVHWDRRSSRWEAKAQSQGVSIRLGYYQTEEEAAIARDYYMRKSEFSDFCRYNFPMNNERGIQSVVADVPDGWRLILIDWGHHIDSPGYTGEPDYRAWLSPIDYDASPCFGHGANWQDALEDAVTRCPARHFASRKNGGA